MPIIAIMRQVLYTSKSLITSVVYDKVRNKAIFTDGNGIYQIEHDNKVSQIYSGRYDRLAVHEDYLYCSSGVTYEKYDLTEIDRDASITYLEGMIGLKYQRNYNIRSMTIDSAGNVLMGCADRVRRNKGNKTAIVAGPTTTLQQMGNINGTGEDVRFMNITAITTVGEEIYLVDGSSNSKRVRVIINGLVFEVQVNYDEKKIPSYMRIYSCMTTDIDGNLLLGCRHDIFKLNPNTGDITPIYHLDSAWIECICLDTIGNLYVGGYVDNGKISELWYIDRSWTLKRLLWIGRMKGNDDCMLTQLPREIVKEICKYVTLI